MNKTVAVTIDFSAEEIAVVWELLRIVQLGDRNEYESAVSDLCIALEKSGLEDRLNEWYKRNGATAPDIWIEANSDCGVTIQLV